MSQQARVLSIEAIKAFRDALCQFGDEVKGALGEVDMEVRRTLEWLLHDRPLYWQSQIKRRKEELAQAQAEVFRRKLQAKPGSTVHDTEQKELMRQAQRRVAEAESKLEVVKKWAPAFQHAVDEYRGRSRPLGDMMDRDLKVALALLDRMTAALDAYIAMAPPSSSSTRVETGVATATAAAGSAPEGSASAAAPEAAAGSEPDRKTPEDETAPGPAAGAEPEVGAEAAAPRAE